MTGVPGEDRERVREDHTSDDSRTQEAIEQDLRDADFESSSAEVFAKEIAGEQALPENEQALVQAQGEAVDSLGSGGAVGGDLLRGEGLDADPGDPPKTVGAPENVDLRVERSGRSTGQVIAENRNTGTEAIVGQADIPAPAEGAE
jgi:hypothetical protein